MTTATAGTSNGTVARVPLSLDPDLAARRAQVLELRRQGWPFRRIGEELGISCGRAHDDFTIAMRALVPVENIEEMRRLDADRLDHAITLVQQIIESPEAPAMARLAAVDRLTGLMARRAKLFGLDAAVQVEHSGVVTVATPDRVAAIRDELADLRSRRIVPRHPKTG